MNYTGKVLLFIVLFFTSIYVFAQQEHSLIFDFKNLYCVDETYDENYDGAPGLFIFMVLMFIFILICVGIGIVIAVLLFLLLFGIIAIGLVSSSILVGLYNKSFLKGFRILIIGGSTIDCAILGIGSFIIYNKIVHYWPLQTSIFVGTLSGSIAGFLLGIIIFYAIRRLTGFFYSKLKATKRI
ncbi:hypothetical protein MKS83_02650 [Chryseobacterium sp. Y16C]|uniref:hypothetical protein n=1 Tax=Chryseobacterium sp. Y16C TaxID=2920939 RepID=UPI001F0B109F|nr:hypothetical protein [Chryseobacterium sp. Y16C]UMQ42597.1 hypothetical protein MKS83_02650 [Chryseobacterium sp. Y16C]